MAKKEMTLTEALAELKLYDKKIRKKLTDLRKIGIVDYKQGSSKVLKQSGLIEDEFERNAQSTFDSLIALINNRKKLKAKIAETNAVTKVNIAGKEYTIVEAIERKNSLSQEKDLLRYLQANFDQIRETVESINERAEEEVDRLLEAKLSSESKNTPAEEIDKLRKLLIQNKIAEIYDPLNIKEVIETLSDDIDEFERQVDVALSIVNARTTIEIDFDEE
jgi:Rad3-related DNA helicase